jgi:hypothetical protein
MFTINSVSSTHIILPGLIDHCHRTNMDDAIFINDDYKKAVISGSVSDWWEVPANFNVILFGAIFD